jgi:hypothetical protein
MRCNIADKKYICRRDAHDKAQAAEEEKKCSKNLSGYIRLYLIIMFKMQSAWNAGKYRNACFSTKFLREI